MKITIEGTIETYIDGVNSNEIEVKETVEDWSIAPSAAEQTIEELAAKVARKLVAAQVA